MTKKQIRLVNILMPTWLISWFATIWISTIRGELFFTGLFALILAVAITEVKGKEVKK